MVFWFSVKVMGFGVAACKLDAQGGGSFEQQGWLPGTAPATVATVVTYSNHTI
jgi:hypothetical protein